MTALDALVARCEKAERERDEWLTPFEGDPIAWHESLPSPYIYKPSDFAALVQAVHVYEARVLAAEARAARLEEALRKIELLPFDANKTSQADLLDIKEIARAALAAAAREGKEEA